MKRALYLSLFLLFTLTACSKSTPKKNNVVEITYWQYWTGFEKDAIKQLVNKFNSTHPNIKVKMVTISEPWKKTLLSIIGGNPPDVLNTTSEWLPDLARRGALIPLNSYCKAHSISRETFIPVYWDMLEKDEVIWGLPMTPSSTALFWNKDRFREAGLDPERPPRTLKELEEYSRKLTTFKENGSIDKIGFLPSWPSWASSIYPLLFNGSWGDSKTGELTANHPSNIKSWEWAQGFSKRLGKNNVQSFQEEFGNIQGPNNPFYSGKIAIEINGVWEGNFISRFAPNLNWGVAPIPTVDGAPTTSVICDAIVIPKGAKYPKEAFEFIAWLTEQENKEELCLLHKKFSPRADTDNEEFLKKHSNPYIKVFIDLAKSKKASYFPATSAFQLYKRELRNAFSDVMRLTATPKEALDKVQEKVEKEISRQRKYETLRKDSMSFPT